MLDKPRWQALKHNLLLEQPALRHDVSLARRHGIQAALMAGDGTRVGGA